MGRVLITEVGRDKLAGDDQLASLFDSFVSAKQPTSKLDAYRWDRGNHSIVYAVGDVALKLCGQATVRYNKFPEDLFKQFHFMSALSTYLKRRGSQIEAPRQYFAVRNRFNDFMLASELKADWQTAESWLLKHGYDYDDSKNAQRQVRRRIHEEITSPFIRMGLNDVGVGDLDGIRNIGNILVPNVADDLLESPLCIIDQPSHGFISYLGSVLAGNIHRKEPVTTIAA